MNSFSDDVRTQRHGPLRDISERQALRRRAPLAEIEGYWTALRGARRLPLRSEIDPRGFKAALPHCFDLERVAPGIARFRVAGSHLAHLTGLELRGNPISSLLTEECQEEFADLLDTVLDTPATASILLSAETGPGRPRLRVRMNLLPVGCEQGETSRVIGALASDEAPDPAVRRFTIDRITVSPIASGEMTGRSARARQAPNSYRPALAPAGKLAIQPCP